MKALLIVVIIALVAGIAVAVLWPQGEQDRGGRDTKPAASLPKTEKKEETKPPPRKEEGLIETVDRAATPRGGAAERSARLKIQRFARMP